jgi:hypothetical protein
MKTLANRGKATRTKKSLRSAENSIIVKIIFENKTKGWDRYSSTKSSIVLLIKEIRIHTTI